MKIPAYVVPAAIALASAWLVSACAHPPATTTAAPTTDQQPGHAGPQSPAAPADAFLATLARYCGQAFAGRVITNTPTPTEPDPFAGKTLIMHVRGCDRPQQELRIPFHVGDDRSRTWVLTRTAGGLRLKHDHRQRDGSPDPLTQYGGDSHAPGTGQRQAFPVDAESIALFKQQDLPASLSNTWAMSVTLGDTFVYELSRPNGRLFQVQFDLRTPVTPPPPPWGG